tara:strand:+ start:1378 stop:2124 length:747 start_codon:yes stop_codon:yes gene_type:complete
MYMKHIIALIIFSFLFSCIEDNNVSDIPSISYESLEFKKSDNSFNQDSLIITINFIDGDGNLGLSNDENNYPYHPYNAIIDQEFNWITLGSNNVTPPLYIYEPNGVYYLYSNEDNRPSYNCEDYIIDTVNTTNKLDTFYIQKNENNKNIFIEFYKKENNEFVLIDWKRIFDQEYGCGIDFNSRFPPLNISNSSQLLSGKLRYGMVSYGFEMILKNDIFKLKIHIKDRELNTSNIIETPEVTLEEILTD